MDLIFNGPLEFLRKAEPKILTEEERAALYAIWRTIMGVIRMRAVSVSSNQHRPVTLPLVVALVNHILKEIHFTEWIDTRVYGEYDMDLNQLSEAERAELLAIDRG